MRFTVAQYLEKECVTVAIRNNNASVALVDGQPTFFDNNNVTSVNLGVDVKRFSEALGQSPHALFAGVAKTNKSGGLVQGDVGEAVVYGFTDIVVTRRTRAASTDSWNSVVSFGAGDLLIPESVGNNFLWTATLPGAVNFPIRVLAGESMASLASASSTFANGSGLTYDGYRMKGLVVGL